MKKHISKDVQSRHENEIKNSIIPFTSHKECVTTPRSPQYCPETNKLGSAKSRTKIILKNLRVSIQDVTINSKVTDLFQQATINYEPPELVKAQKQVSQTSSSKMETSAFVQNKRIDSVHGVVRSEELIQRIQISPKRSQMVCSFENEYPNAEKSSGLIRAARNLWNAPMVPFPSLTHFLPQHWTPIVSKGRYWNEMSRADRNIRHRWNKFAWRSKSEVLMKKGITYNDTVRTISSTSHIVKKRGSRRKTNLLNHIVTSSVENGFPVKVSGNPNKISDELNVVQTPISKAPSSHHIKAARKAVKSRAKFPKHDKYFRKHQTMNRHVECILCNSGIWPPNREKHLLKFHEAEVSRSSKIKDISST